MDQFRFRPQVHGLEDRLTPAVSPADVFAAVNRANDSQLFLQRFVENLDQPWNVYERQYYISQFQAQAEESLGAAVVLEEFRATLAATGASGGQYAQTTSWATNAQVKAITNIAHLQLYTVALGGTPVRNTPPEPPPPPPPETPPDDGPISRDTSGLSLTVPPLDAPEWRDIGNGLRVWDTVEGRANLPPLEAGQAITVQYTGWLTDGTVFDSTVPELSTRGADGQPVTFDLDNLIQGWQLALPGMRPGGIRRLDIPAELGYGEAGSPPSIPPNARLIFEIKLIEVDAQEIEL